MTGRMAIIGDGDSIMVFKAAGIATFAASDAKNARELIRKAARDYKIIYVTEEFYRPNEEYMKRFDEEPYPVVLMIPNAGESTNYGYELLRKEEEEALGVDILFNK
ncbi:MAG: hypothetical protein LUE27_11820 [Clostridia bacterium]|nr:hypothetical protein [Clostridia bacterium]